MPDVELSAGQLREAGDVSSSDPSSDLEVGEDGGGQRRRGSASPEASSGGSDGTAACPAAGAVPLGVVASKAVDTAALKAGIPKSIDGWVGAAPGAASAKDGSSVETAAAKKGVPRSESYHEECRVCQEETDELLVDLGCSCRGELAKAHLSCIETWFRTRGSNKCEICQQVAVNVPTPESQPNANYWIWRVDPAFGGTTRRRAERDRVCINPLWIAFCILIGGLLLDVLISFSFGISALPVNIIIGGLIVLGLGTAIRLALECCHEWNMQRIARRAAAAAAENTVDPHYPPDDV